MSQLMCHAYHQCSIKKKLEMLVIYEMIKCLHYKISFCMFFIVPTTTTTPAQNNQLTSLSSTSTATSAESLISQQQLNHHQQQQQQVIIQHLQQQQAHAQQHPHGQTRDLTTSLHHGLPHPGPPPNVID
jgi:hypothetical protein